MASRSQCAAPKSRAARNDCPSGCGHHGQALEALGEAELIHQGAPHTQALSIQPLCLPVVALVPRSSGKIARAA